MANSLGEVPKKQKAIEGFDGFGGTGATGLTRVQQQVLKALGSVEQA